MRVDRFLSQFMFLGLGSLGFERGEVFDLVF
jgi:hypothetical protein